MLPNDPVDQNTPEERIATLVDTIIQDPQHRDRLIELLPALPALNAGRGAH